MKRFSSAMKRFFPIMNDDTEKGMHFALLAYWVFAFWFLPFWMPLLGDGYWENLPVISWFEIVYHVLNSLVVGLMMKAYLADSFLSVQMDPKGFFKTVGWTALAMLTLAVWLYILMGEKVVDVYPVSGMTVALTSGYLVEIQPLFGTICSSLFLPFSVVGLFYVTGFAPVCRRNPWLGYVVVTVVLALPCAFDILWRDQTYLVIPTYVMRLPFHWLACWTYQKADTVWAPIATLAIFNLGTSLLALL